tara:strand:+ start:36 stop:221 length:186 start_codon:yes stop_codon:yes gene_type:complete
MIKKNRNPISILSKSTSFKKTTLKNLLNKNKETKRDKRHKNKEDALFLTIKNNVTKIVISK